MLNVFFFMKVYSYSVAIYFVLRLIRVVHIKQLQGIKKFYGILKQIFVYISSSWNRYAYYYKWEQMYLSQLFSSIFSNYPKKLPKILLLFFLYLKTN